MRNSKLPIKRLGRIALFMVILLIILLVLSELSTMLAISDDKLVQKSNKSRYLIQREEANTIDVLITGDSLSYSTFSPMELWHNQGISAYVSGQPGQNIVQTYTFLQKALKTQSPKLVILETDTMFNGMNNDKVTPIKFAATEWVYDHLSILRNHDMWKTLIAGKSYPQDNYKGFSFRCKLSPYTGGDYMQATEDVAPLPEVVTTYMDKINQLCQENGAELMLISSPSPKNFNYSRHNAIAQYAAKKGYRYLDLNLQLNELGIDWSADSLDGGDHLNFRGAIKASDYLASYLAENYTLTDHREDSAYAEWNRLYKRYQKKITHSERKLSHG